MAQRRMISLKVVDTDEFVDMPIGSRLLYYDLSMRADDDGFVASPKKIMRMVNASEDDYKVLIAKRFLIQFGSGVCVIRHWYIHNLIRSDRYCGTEYKDEMKLLRVVDGKYVKTSQENENVIPDGNQMAPQVRVGKVRIGKENTLSGKPDVSFETFWNAYPKKELKKKSLEIWKSKKLDSKIGEILEFIRKAKETDRWKRNFVKQPTTFLRNECWNDDLASYGSEAETEYQGIIKV